MQNDVMHVAKYNNSERGFFRADAVCGMKKKKI